MHDPAPRGARTYQITRLSIIRASLDGTGSDSVARKRETLSRGSHEIVDLVSDEAAIAADKQRLEGS